MDKTILYAILRQDFKSFVMKVFHEISAGAEYQNNWHIDVVCNALMDMMEGKNNRLIINIPPRHMKSIICSVALPAYLLGINPKTTLICISYSEELTTKFANDCRIILQTSWYQDLFPRTRLQSSRKAVNDFETTAGGGRFATSIGGTLTGRGADWIIIDDPLKPTEAMSDLQREKVNDWYGSTLYSRLNDKVTGKILLIMQRLHQHDLTGYLLEASTTFRHLRLPILAEEEEEWITTDRISGNTKQILRQQGDPLHPDREDMSVIADLRKSLGEFAFAGQYQQRPTPVEGGLIKKQWLHFYHELPKNFRKIFLSWDTATKVGASNAFSACVVIGLGNDKKMYILDCFRERLEFPELIQKIIQLHMKENEKYNSQSDYVRIETLIEEASSGVQAIQQIKKSHSDIRVTPIKPTQDKATRLMGISSYIENGTCLFPNNAGHWWKEFETELLTFPNSTFKDQCDALSQGIEYGATRPSYPHPNSLVINFCY